MYCDRYYYWDDVASFSAFILQCEKFSSDDCVQDVYVGPVRNTRVGLDLLDM